MVKIAEDKKVKNIEPKQPQKKWYQKAWDSIKTGAKKAYQFMTSNATALTTIVVGIALSPFTAGGSLAVAAATLTVKVGKTILDTTKAMETRKLNKETEALLALASETAKQKTFLAISRNENLKNLVSETDREAKKSSKQPVKLNKTLEAVSTVIDNISRIADLASTAMLVPNLVQGIQALPAITKKTHALIQSVIEFSEKPLDLAGGIQAGLEYKEGAEAIKESQKKTFADKLGEALTKSPKVKQEFVDLINEQRNNEHIGYNDLNDIYKQTRQMQAENRAIKDVLDAGPQAINSKEKLEHIFNNSLNDHLVGHSAKGIDKVPEVPKQENLFKRIGIGLKNALFGGKYTKPDELEVPKHSPLTLGHQNVGITEIPKMDRTVSNIGISKEALRQEHKMQQKFEQAASRSSSSVNITSSARPYITPPIKKSSKQEGRVGPG